MSTESARDLQLLCGNLDLLNADYCDIPFADDVLTFCAVLSEKLLSHQGVRESPDLATFAFYCRKANLQSLKQQLDLHNDRLGWGKALHIAPSNIPVNFAYSFLFGLLAGNSNLVRVPSRDFPQIPLFCDMVTELFDDDRFCGIAEHNAFVSFAKESAFLKEHITRFDALLVWGGDQTVADIRALPRAPRCVEVAFSDRYSFALLDADAVLALGNDPLNDLCRKFYNDTYLVDQNACSSPSLVAWQGSRDSVTSAKERFWPALQRYVLQHYHGNAVQVMDKQIVLMKYLEKYEGCGKLTDYGGLVMVAGLEAAVDYNHELKGIFGLFFELEQSRLEDILPVVNKKYQTLTYFGIDPQAIKETLFAQRCPGIDRVVPVGSALDIGLHWDGYDLIRTLSRAISVK